MINDEPKSCILIKFSNRFFVGQSSLLRIQDTIKSTTGVEYKSLRYGQLDGEILDHILLHMDLLLEVKLS
jgi:hypothetical protein